MVVVPRKVLPVDEQVVVLVQLPELAVDHVEVLVAEEVGDLVDIVLLLEESQRCQKIRMAQLRQTHGTRPRPVHLVEHPRDHLLITNQIR